MKLKLKIGALALLALSLGACSEFSDDSADIVYQESDKDLSGEWQLVSVTRNLMDISTEMDFSSFCVKLNADGTYVLENYLPFVVKKNGTWAVDDPKYPFNLTFTDESGNVVKAEIGYPIVAGKRMLSFTLSPGSVKNTYIYGFERISKK